MDLQGSAGTSFVRSLELEVKGVRGWMMEPPPVWKGGLLYFQCSPLGWMAGLHPVVAKGPAAWDSISTLWVPDPVIEFYHACMDKIIIPLIQGALTMCQSLFKVLYCTSQLIRTAVRFGFMCQKKEYDTHILSLKSEHSPFTWTHHIVGKTRKPEHLRIRIIIGDSKNKWPFGPFCLSCL